MHTAEQSIIAFGLSLWSNNAILIGIIALVVPLIGGSLATYKTKKTLSIISITCAFICCGLILFAFFCNKEWCIVPNLYGKTYSNAIDTLYSNGLEGFELLASSSRSQEDVNVVWQSKEKDSIISRGEIVFIVLDDNTKYEKKPASKSIGPIDSRMWTWDKHNNTIRMMLPQTYSTMKSNDPNAITFDIYVDSLATTLELIVIDYIDTNRNYLQINLKTFEDYSFVGRLCANDENDPKMQCVKTTSINGAMLLPIVMNDNYYGFYFSFYDEDGNHYDHAIPIEFISEYEWNHT